MSDEFYATSNQPEEKRRIFISYLLGFSLSILLTVAAYYLVDKELLLGSKLRAAILGLGVLQMIAQFVFFLHLGQESKPRWNFLVFLFMGLVFIILVFGSLWIMHHLNYRMMSTEEMEAHMRYENNR